MNRKQALEEIKLANEECRPANLGKADLRGADLGGANLCDASLGDADLRWANLGEANLSGAYLSCANLGDADLSSADLRGADLRLANLGEAYFGGAKIKHNEKEIILSKVFGFNSLYKYWVAIYIDTENNGYIRMGCLFKSLKEWEEIGIENSNLKGFPNDGSSISNERINAFNFAKEKLTELIKKT